MVRYMLFMSYIGTRYRGVQKQIGCEAVIDVDSIQGAVEAGLRTLIPKSLIKPALTLSSRTDAGVHALCSTASVELTNRYGTIYDTDHVLKWMNRYFLNCGHEIRLTSFFPVTDTFHPRFQAKSRTYVYRIVYPKDNDELKLPIAELGHSWNIGTADFDIEKVIAGTRLFKGLKNFETFSGKNRTEKEFRYVRSLKELRVEKGDPLMALDPLAENFNYYNIICSSKSFLYNQVRRIVSSLIGLGLGKLSEKDINIMLHVPSPLSWRPEIPVAPPYGLYLKEVTYDPVELANNRIRHSEEIPPINRMDLASRLQEKKSTLKATKTILTKATGDRYEIVDGKEQKLNETCSPFVVDDKPDMQIVCVTEGVYLSSQDPAMCPETLKAHSIRNVLSLGIQLPRKEDEINYYYVEFLDLPEFELSKVAEECLRIINDCKRGNILVHCNAGVSRSASIVIAYLMITEKLTYDEAFAKVKSKRNCIKPNDGFVKQLRAYKQV